MPDWVRGAGVFFYDMATRRVLFYRRDNKPTIPFPDQIDILGGHIEAGETADQAVVREMAGKYGGGETNGNHWQGQSYA